MSDIQSSFARTINERHLGITAVGVMSDCFLYGITYGCTVNCPVLMRGECELMHDENAELYAECVREHSLENDPGLATAPQDSDS